MDSINRFVIKIDQVKNALSLDRLKGLVSDLWAWCDENPQANPLIFDNANEIEEIIANCYDKEVDLNISEKDIVSLKLDEIIKALKSTVN